LQYSAFLRGSTFRNGTEKEKEKREGGGDPDRKRRREETDG